MTNDLIKDIGMGIVGIILLILGALFLFIGIFFVVFSSGTSTLNVVIGIIIILACGMLVASRMRLFAMRIFVR